MVKTTSTSNLDKRLFLSIDKRSMITICLVMLCFNAMLYKISQAIILNGTLHSVTNTFEISVIVWGGLWLGFSCTMKMGAEPTTPTDIWVLTAICTICLLPLSPLMWPMVSVFAIYCIMTARNTASIQAKVGWIFLALTMPMFWGKRIFSLFSDYLLSADALLVATAMQTEQTSNLVAIPGGGFLQIAAPCSSMANVSLAILCWVLFTTYHGVPWKPQNILWCLTACLSVVAINVTRISLIGFNPEYYELIHGEIGSTITSWLDVFVLVVICSVGCKVLNASRP